MAQFKVQILCVVCKRPAADFSVVYTPDGVDITCKACCARREWKPEPAIRRGAR